MNMMQTVSVNLTNSQRKALNSSETMKHVHTAQKNGEVIQQVFCDRNKTMGWDDIQIQTEKTCFSWSITPRGRIVFTRVFKK